jgi:hypothetical protein
MTPNNKPLPLTDAEIEQTLQDFLPEFESDGDKEEFLRRRPQAREANSLRAKLAAVTRLAKAWQAYTDACDAYNDGAPGAEDLRESAWNEKEAAEAACNALGVSL